MLIPDYLADMATLPLEEQVKVLTEENRKLRAELAEVREKIKRLAEQSEKRDGAV
jgi:antitoxin component of MazEF toxin-antitoxin module